MAVPVAGKTTSKEDSSGGILAVVILKELTAVVKLKGLTAVVELVSATGTRTTNINIILNKPYSTY